MEFGDKEFLSKFYKSVSQIKAEILAKAIEKINQNQFNQIVKKTQKLIAEHEKEYKSITPNLKTMSTQEKEIREEIAFFKNFISFMQTGVYFDYYKGLIFNIEASENDSFEKRLFTIEDDIINLAKKGDFDLNKLKPCFVTNIKNLSYLISCDKKLFLEIETDKNCKLSLFKNDEFDELFLRQTKIHKSNKENNFLYKEISLFSLSFNSLSAPFLLSTLQIFKHKEQNSNDTKLYARISSYTENEAMFKQIDENGIEINNQSNQAKLIKIYDEKSLENSFNSLFDLENDLNSEVDFSTIPM